MQSVRGGVDDRQRLLAKSNVKRYFDEVKPESPIADLAAYTTDLAASGRSSFTTKEAVAALGKTDVAVRAAIRRLARHGAIATPVRGFHLLVPPEYRRLGCLPPEQFIPDLMRVLGRAYYVGLLSAAQYHGAGHQRPQAFFVVEAKNRAPIVCGAVRVEFVAKKWAKGFPVATFNTPRGTVAVSTPELTAIDLVAYPARSGGLDAVATVLAELAERIDPKELAVAAGQAPRVLAQRLGHLLDAVDGGAVTGPLAALVADSVRDYAPLEPSLPASDAVRDAKWRILVNVDLEPDL